MHIKKIIQGPGRPWSLCISRGISADHLRYFPAERIFASVPDLHGRIDVAKEVISILEFMEIQNCCFTGDYVDRQPNSKEVLDVLIAAKQRNPTWEFLAGNHDLMAIENIRYGTPSIEENPLIGQISPDDFDRYAEFLESLPVYFETKYLIFVHGGIWQSYAQKNIDKISAKELTWSSGVHPKYRGKVVVTGHQIVSEPHQVGLRICTETGGWLNSRPFQISLVADVEGPQQLIGWLQLEPLQF